MADIQLDNQSAPTTPSSGSTVLYVDSTSKLLSVKDDAGLVRAYGNSINNYSTTSQSPSATTRTYITGSALSIPSGKIQIGTMFRWKWSMTKTAAGTATSTIDVAVGTAGTTSDTARVSFTKPAGTAAADEAWCEVNVTCRGPLSASGIFVGEFRMIHNLASTGHAVIPCVVVNTVSSAFDVTTANLIVGLCITTGTSDAITIQMVQAEALNL